MNILHVVIGLLSLAHVFAFMCDYEHTITNRTVLSVCDVMYSCAAPTSGLCHAPFHSTEFSSIAAEFA